MTIPASWFAAIRCEVTIVSPVTLNLVAIAIFTVTMTSLLGGILGIPPAVPAVVTAGLLGAATLDNFALEGRGGTLVVDWFSQFSDDHRQRVVHHEAGHFLVAHLLGIPVTGYTLNAWEAFRKGQPGRGGVSFDTQDLGNQMAKGQVPVQKIDAYCAVWMAGIAAEQMVYGNAEGGSDDCQQLRTLWTQIEPPKPASDVKIRWSALKAKTLLETHKETYHQLVDAMMKRLPVEDCLAIANQATMTSA
ncbi:MAG: ATP-dependent Zn protease [Leptolyngbyaceae bacterium]|nr:ATP-dependent Zn protease [Leptolyngbyaceae bacterium]